MTSPRAAEHDAAALMDAAIARVRGGESVGAVLAELTGHAGNAAPEEIEELRPLLTLASSLSALAPAPDAERSLARARVRAAVMSAARERLAAPAAPAGWLRPAGFAAAAASAVIALGGGGALSASASALPGEPLYAVKLAVEEARASVASVAGDPSAQAALHAQLAQRRVDEALVERKQSLPPGALEAANRHAEKARRAAERAPDSQRPQVVPTLTAALDQRTETLTRLLTAGDLPAPAQTAIAAALEKDRKDRDTAESHAEEPRGPQPPNDDSSNPGQGRGQGQNEGRSQGQGPARGQGQGQGRGQDNDRGSADHSADNRGRSSRATPAVVPQAVPSVSPPTPPAASAAQRPEAAAAPNRGPGTNNGNANSNRANANASSRKTGSPSAGGNGSRGPSASGAPGPR